MKTQPDTAGDGSPSAAAFLAAHEPDVSEETRWDALRLRVASYLCASLPPVELITSARAVLLRGNEPVHVMVLRDQWNEHILPGGRLEDGESVERALRRELMEETGWTVDRPVLLGVKRFTHLDPKPAGFAYPDYLYPDFFQAVHVAHAVTFHPDGRELDGYELDATFRPVDEVESLALAPNERLFLRAALDRRGRSASTRPDLAWPHPG